MKVQRKADKRVKMKASTPEIEWSPCPDIVEDPDVTWLLYRKTRQHTRFVLIRVSDCINLFYAFMCIYAIIGCYIFCEHQQVL